MDGDVGWNTLLVLGEARANGPSRRSGIDQPPPQTRHIPPPPRRPSPPQDTAHSFVAATLLAPMARGGEPYDDHPPVQPPLPAQGVSLDAVVGEAEVLYRRVTT